MSISKQEVEHIAKLAHLKLSDTEVRQYSEQLSQILDYVAMIDKLNLDDVEPLSHVLDLVNVLRKDQNLPSLDREEVLANAKESDHPFFIVPRVVE